MTAATSKNKETRLPTAILRHAQEMIHTHTRNGQRPGMVVLSVSEWAELRKYLTATSGLPADPGLPIRMDGILVSPSAKVRPGMVGVVTQKPAKAKKGAYARPA
jgi:hypothetical protein